MISIPASSVAGTCSKHSSSPSAVRRLGLLKMALQPQQDHFGMFSSMLIDAELGPGFQADPAYMKSLQQSTCKRHEVPTRCSVKRGCDPALPLLALADTLADEHQYRGLRRYHGGSEARTRCSSICSGGRCLSRKYPFVCSAQTEHTDHPTSRAESSSGRSTPFTSMWWSAHCQLARTRNISSFSCAGTCASPIRRR